MLLPRCFVRVLGVTALAVIAGGAIGCGGAPGGGSQADPGGNTTGTAGAEKKPEADAIPVRVAAIRRAAISSLYSTSATLRADKTATITARTRGVVRRLLVEEGDRVNEGATVAVLEDDEQRIARERARTNAENKKRTYERAAALVEQGLMAEEEFETARREAQDAEHAFSLADLELSRTQIRAPFSGKILKRHLDVGATVSDGTAVFDVADLDPLYADINVPERHVSQLEPGQVVRLSPGTEGKAAIEARIARIAPGVDPSTGTVKVTVTASEAAGLRPGSFVRVDIVTDTHDDALVVPRSALVAEGRRWHVFLLDDAGEMVAQQEVTVGFEEGDLVEILAEREAGAVLVPDARVVVVGASALTDGARVKLSEGSGETANATTS